ncbi:MAG: hypothetical protein UV82_C0001G0025 [Candidatus Magasanikbacteria bacterium GW2011_GWD2_43_18]|uniref:DUF11 domain-containing protein n=1 Tax=Candidatus Magasanikbacteria bacterium GW2011_GWE2_42_7 TaxID=1619052 RepID=A0A0G1BHR2_9BACT|nr:MAG: hypothetical protein UV18_C0001G0056 [Candidatus Magasanikbacteria bacterium GW2011_GWC2_42_27]KKS72877.1 MAG: hypothetical protein UV42_C0003G0006 [Candidatus Magasanikbacteria bacterium GW2011_GWE2_42_7]KKT05236.1 MAG: hypothetical protein UV82_C0001G0025 [Candidatus Magasanikbacteria bacterium GW2011_GWD2_43_18]KKT26142.1 MAG: hypothetical protein UW10_C0001G0056 [Candidatus Magasanikbacteria bacterium GW2011_GWA2_43_9]HBB37573.1 hypothetical protein [Candidatus Magasanikbacteria bac
MQFYEQHFTRHHFRHNFHKWFGALLLSPIHHAEMRYKNHYHLKFSHAKKLFVFDMLLLLSTVLLFGASLFWWLYDPTVTELVHLDVNADVETTRFQSGDDITLTISYKNESDVFLTNPRISIHLPLGFLITDASLPYEQGDNGSVLFPIETILPKQAGTMTVRGRLYGTPDQHIPIQTMLLYTQAGRDTPESDVHRLFLSPRDSSVDITFSGPPQYIPGVDMPFSLEVRNTQDHTLQDIMFNLSDDAIVWVAASSSDGIVLLDNTTHLAWQISQLEAGAFATLNGTLRITRPERAIDQFTWELFTLLRILEQNVPEQTTPIAMPIASPQVRLSSIWNSAATTLGEQELLTISVENTGNIPLERPRVSVLGNTVNLDTQVLAPGQTLPVTIGTSVSEDAITNGTDGPLFLPTITFSASLPGINTYTYTTTAEAPPLPIGTTLTMNQSSRYYTDEGDQLGRGPLPPKVGEETKYWIFTQIKNTIGEVRDVRFSTTIAPGAIWTGKSSVSKGGDITYNAGSRTAIWNARSMNPYETVGIYFEIAVTPSASHIGTIPLLTSEATVSASDPYVDDTLSASVGAINASLNGDQIGKTKGVVVQ